MKKYAIIEAEEVFNGKKGDLLNDRNYNDWVNEQSPLDESEKDFEIFETLEEAEEKLAGYTAKCKICDPRHKGLPYEIRLWTYQIVEVFEDEDGSITDWGNTLRITPFDYEVI